MACPGYSDDPPCKTIRKLNAEGAAPSRRWCLRMSLAPSAGASHCCSATAQYGRVHSRAPAIPKCKYVKQELLDVKCPKDGGDIAVRKTKRGDTFYGCVNYPKCDFRRTRSSSPRPVPSARARMCSRWRARMGCI